MEGSGIKYQDSRNKKQDSRNKIQETRFKKQETRFLSKNLFRSFKDLTFGFPIFHFLNVHKLLCHVSG